MPKPIIADPNGTASILNMEAIAALGRGDTALAQQKRAEAGQILERRMKAVGRAREKHYLRFLAATQFYKGGHYRHAAELAEKIDPKLLDARARELLPNFLTDVRDRSGAGYAPRVGTKLKALWEAREWNGLLATLAEHQYILTPGGTAWVRGVCCLQLGQLKASALFFAQALRDPTVKVFALQSSAQPVLDWAIAGQFREAREYARLLAEIMPNEAADSVLAYAEFARLMRAPESDHDSIAREQIAAMDRAAGSADALLATVGDDITIRRLVAIGAGVTALTCRWLGDDVRATRFRELAVRLDREDALDLASWFTKWDQIRDSLRPITEPLMQFVGRVASQSKPQPSLREFTVAA